MSPTPILRILLLEDDPRDAELIAETLKAEGIAGEFIVVDDRAAFETTLGQPLDLILSDFAVPQFDGLAALGLARRRRPEVPFVFVSGAIGEEQLIDLLTHGATDYVVKSRLKRLGPAVRRALGEASSQAERRRVAAALQQSEERLRLAQQIGRTGTFDWNIKRDEVLWSAEIAALYGLPAETFIGSCKAWCELIHPDDRAGLEERVSEAMQSGQFEGEWRAIWPDGTTRWLAGRSIIYRDEAGQPERMLGVNVDITERKEAEAHHRRAALHDPLTGLPNRLLLYESAEHLLPAVSRGNAQAAFLFVDLDRFKPINDTYGHSVGDAVLKEVARRMKETMRAEDLVGRLGGDEFVAVLAHIHGEDAAARIARFLLDRLGQPYAVNGLDLQVLPSIGISLFPQDGSSVDELIKCADAAMYAVKQSGRSNFQFFRPELQARTGEALRIESRLHGALERSEFELFVQPIIDLDSGKMVAAEALIRWPAMAVPPDRFIPVAELAGLMQTLGAWVLQEACRLRGLWRQHGLPAFPISVNVSPIQIRQADFVQCLAAEMERAGLQADDLKLEITESVLINNVDEAIAVLRAIRGRGIHVALDDFGTGYSSLSYLTQLPIDSIKLDQSFVRQLGYDRRSAAVADSVIALADSLDLSVVAEGIESSEALAFLKKHHCPQGQGFLISHPLPAREFEAWCWRRAA